MVPTATPPSDTAAEQVALAGCARVHHLWRRELAALARTTGQPAEIRTAALVADVYRPYTAFWAGYLGDEVAFREWVGTRFTLDADPRRDVPLATDPGALIVDATRRMAEFAGRPVPCSDWYVVYGPGWTNMGTLRDIGMVVDFLGMPRDSAAADFRAALPHEVTHLLTGAARVGDPDAGTVLSRVVDEGFATYATWRYWGGSLTPARALGYTDAEWRWALAHEREVWALAAPRLRSRERAVVDTLAAAGIHPLANGPGKVGYFVGFRIAQAYVARHGPDAWRDLFALPYARVLAGSGYPDAAVRAP